MVKVSIVFHPLYLSRSFHVPSTSSFYQVFRFIFLLRHFLISTFTLRHHQININNAIGSVPCAVVDIVHRLLLDIGFENYSFSFFKRYYGT